MVVTPDIFISLVSCEAINRFLQETLPARTQAGHPQVALALATRAGTNVLTNIYLVVHSHIISARSVASFPAANRLSIPLPQKEIFSSWFSGNSSSFQITVWLTQRVPSVPVRQSISVDLSEVPDTLPEQVVVLARIP